MTIEDGDESLVVAAQHGDLAAWEKLCQKQMPRLAAYLGSRLRRPDIVDRLISEVVAGAWKHLPELEQPSEFHVWLRRIGGGVALQWSRKHPNEAVTAPFPTERCGTDLALAERMQTLEVALGLLPDAQRMVLEQHFRGHMSIYDLASAMHLQPEGVQMLIEESLMALDRALKAEL
jgi:DNA-directed RNA polymerase specialized sigma24 family protein